MFSKSSRCDHRTFGNQTLIFRPTQKSVFIQVQLRVSVLTNHQAVNTILKKQGKNVKYMNLPHIILFF
jgi:hypothetical protein